MTVWAVKNAKMQKSLSMALTTATSVHDVVRSGPPQSSGWDRRSRSDRPRYHERHTESSQNSTFWGSGEFVYVVGPSFIVLGKTVARTSRVFDFQDGGRRTDRQKSCNWFLNNYNAEYGLKQHLFLRCKAFICTFSFFISLINPQLTSLYCSLISHGSKKGPAKYFGTQKVGGLFYILAPPHFSKWGAQPPSPPAPPPLHRTEK